MLETLEIGFVVALQQLPARRRALLLLRDVAGFSATETAEILDAGDEWVEAELPRARTQLDASRRRRRGPPPPPGSPAERRLLARFETACASADARALASLLAADVRLTVPAAGFELRGRWPVRDALPTGPSVHLLRARANGQPAFAWYVLGRADGIIVLTLEGEHIGEITCFPGHRPLRLLGLPRAI